MKLNNRGTLAQIVNLEPGEGPLVGLLFMLYFFLGAAYSFTQASAFPIFLLNFSSRDLPWVYMTNAVVVVAITFVYLKLGSRLSFSTLLSGNIIFLFFVILAFRFGLNIPSNRWVIFCLPVLFQILINFGNLAFWSLAGRLLNVRQAKRLFGLVGGGQWAAIVLIGFLIPAIVSGIGTANLLLLASASMVLVFAILVTLTRAFAEKLKVTDAVPESSSSQAASPARPYRYVLLLFGLIILWWMAYYFIDNIFYAQLALQFPEEEKLAGFMGFYLAGQAFLILLINTFIAGPVISRFGVRGGLLILPAGLIAITLAGSIFGTFGTTASILFVLAVLSKLINMGLGFSIDLSSQNIMYQPMPPKQRVQTKTLADGIIQPLGNGLAGLALLLFTSVFAFGMAQLETILLVIIAGWLVVAIFLNREYPQMLRKALSRRHLEGAELALADETSVGILMRELHNPQAGIILYALNALEKNSPAALVGSIPMLLEHPSSEVRQAALACVERIQAISALSVIRQREQEEADPAVRGSVLRVLAALDRENALDTLLPYIHNPDPALRLGAILGLMRSCGIEGILAAGNTLLEMSKSSYPDQRRLAAQIIGQLEVPGFYDPLITLAADKQREVRRAAIRAAGQVKNPKLVPVVVEALKDPALRPMAAAALSGWGETVLPCLFDNFSKNGQNLAFQMAVIDVVGRTGGEQAIAWLKQKLGAPSAHVRAQILRSLRSRGYLAETSEVPAIQDQIRSEAALGFQILAITDCLGRNDAEDLLRDALLETLDQVKERIFDLISFTSDPRVIQDVRQNLACPQANRRAYALEVLDVIIPQAVKGWVYPLWTDGTAHQKLQQLKPHFPALKGPQMDLEQGLRQVLSEPDRNCMILCQACALYTIGIRSMTDLVDYAQEALASPEPLLRETAAWTMSKLKAKPDVGVANRLYHDPAAQVRRAIALLEAEERLGGDTIMLTTLEKVIALKKSSIFAALPNETLAAVAPLLEEQWFDDGTMIIHQGELGDCMYIIVQGKVCVHDGELTLNFLEEGKVFGEMAVLDAEPRVASVTAAADTCLLRLSQEPLFELIDEQPALSRGIIRTLSAHLRARIQDMNALQIQLAVPK